MASNNRNKSLLDTFGLRTLMGYDEKDSDDLPKISPAFIEFIEWFEVQLKNLGETDVEIRDGGIIRSIPSIEVEDVKDIANHFILALQKRFIGVRIPESEAAKKIVKLPE